MRVPLDSAVVGMSHISPVNDHPTMATVFFHRIKIIAENLRVSQGPLFGRALAHEVGHLLLGRGYHARSGLMRCPWKRQDLKNAAWGRLLLSPEEAKRILSNVDDQLRAQDSLVAP